MANDSMYKCGANVEDEAGELGDHGTASFSYAVMVARTTAQMAMATVAVRHQFIRR